MCNKKIMLHMNVENYPRHQTKLSCGQCGFELHIHFHHFWWHKWIIIETAAHFYTHTNIYIHISWTWTLQSIYFQFNVHFAIAFWCHDNNVLRLRFYHLNVKRNMCCIIASTIDKHSSECITSVEWMRAIAMKFNFYKCVSQTIN